MKQKAIIIDLDNILVNSQNRFKRLDMDAYEKKDSKNFIKSIYEYNKDCAGDTVIEEGLDLLTMLTNFYKPNKIFFITARGENNRVPTLKWLKEENIWDNTCELIMHDEKLIEEDYSFNSQDIHAKYKRNAALKIQETYDILIAVDDSENNCQAYCNIGIPTIKFMIPGLGRTLI